ncbi:MAG: histidinol-phosphate transaminase [Candidatus Thermoplasmatota archaeon]|nr:histidinol-phosphate transaminase [Candidatus Thermoplasmatota archaeon]
MGISYPEKGSEVPLDSNENLLLPEEYYEDIKDELDFSLRNYPSPTSTELKRCLADFHGLNHEQVVVDNGSDAVLDTICKTFVPKDSTLGYFHPSYEMYSFFASRNDRKAIEIPLDPDFTLPSKIDYLNEVEAVLVCSPNNPSGLHVKRKKIITILENVELAVIDEAYVEYSERDHISLIEEYDNLIIVRTFSKAWGLAGIRVGYALMSAEKGVEYLENMLPYNVNSVSSEVALSALEKKSQVEKSINKTIEERERLSDELDDRSFNPLPSDTNFLLCKKPAFIEASELYQELLERGIRIRTFEEPRLEDHVRITVGDRETNDHFLETLDEIL